MEIGMLLTTMPELSTCSPKPMSPTSVMTTSQLSNDDSPLSGEENTRPLLGLEAGDDQFCRLCLKSFSSRKYRVLHVETVHHHFQNHACSLCDQKFGTRSSMRRHMKTVHHKEKPHTCNVCKTAFGTKSSMARHIKTVHKEP
eukprot:Plantae.Rhodophyta-Purpureofilum_apyrenoidigerum.ctg11503.p1 GENE.Plantae.Rhodophyta-Purpureofilum_apyrenoidigerum.ctg11503~~Plantae.Rhodophyta-Purpureofilum_apyrenoidigerum.ctg11503.p1  ORF type:complete len:142 (+),score=10.69 Plantae.Rhodophyta-Purpureofilum_apyrenoidigerum.ctg11503:77-502(+)